MGRAAANRSSGCSVPALRASFSTHLLKIETEVKALGPPHGPKNCGCSKQGGMLPVKYFYLTKPVVVSTESQADHKTVKAKVNLLTASLGDINGTLKTVASVYIHIYHKYTHTYIYIQTDKAKVNLDTVSLGDITGTLKTVASVCINIYHKYTHIHIYRLTKLR